MLYTPSHSWFLMLLLFIRLCLFFTLGVSALSSPLFTDNEVFDMPTVDSSQLLRGKKITRVKLINNLLYTAVG